MKSFFSFIIIVGIFSTSVTQCCLGDNCDDIIVEQHDVDHKSKELSIQTCSQLFTCNNCNGFFMYEAFEFSIYLNYQLLRTEHSFFSTTDVFVLIWKPPKVSLT